MLELSVLAIRMKKGDIRWKKNCKSIV